MADAGRGGTLDDAHRQIPVLRALVADPEATDFAHELRAIDPEMAHIILNEEEVGIPIGLEVVVVAMTVLIDFVLVAVDQVGFGMGVEFEGDAGQGVRPDFIIVIEQRDELAVRQCERRV